MPDGSPLVKHAKVVGAATILLFIFMLATDPFGWTRSSKRRNSKDQPAGGTPNPRAVDRPELTLLTSGPQSATPEPLSSEPKSEPSLVGTWTHSSATSRTPVLVSLGAQPGDSMGQNELTSRYVAAGRSRALAEAAATPPSDTDIQACRVNTACHFRNGCVTDNLGVCRKANFNLTGGFEYLPQKPQGQKFYRRPSGGKRGEQLECSWMPKASSTLPTLDLQDTSPEGVVNNFKYLSGMSFQKWYDWPAPIKFYADETTPNPAQDPPQDVAEDGTVVRRTRMPEMQGRHEGVHQVYALRDFCLSLNGKMSGSFAVASSGKKPPKVDAFRGGNDMMPQTAILKGTKWKGMAKEFKMTMEGFTKKLFKAANLNVPSPPGGGGASSSSWYIDRKLILVPVYNDLRESSALIRSGATIFNIEDGFPRPNAARRPGTSEVEKAPEVAREDVTTLYVPVNGGLHTPNYRKTVFHLYSSLAATTHASLFDSDSDFLAEFRRLHNQQPTVPASDANPGPRPNISGLVALGKVDMNQLTKFLSTPVCFKEAVVQQNCYLDDCLSLKPTARHSFTRGGWRSPAAVQTVARRLRACAGVSYLEKRRRKADAPTVLFAVRGGARALHAQMSLLPKVRRWLDELGRSESKLVALEMNSMSVPELVALHSQVDILISGRNSAALFGFLVTQPGAVGIEIGISGGIARMETGLNTNPSSDDGSMWESVKANHYTIASAEGTGITSPPWSHYLVADSMLKRALGFGLALLPIDAGLLDKAPTRRASGEQLDPAMQRQYALHSKDVSQADHVLHADPSGHVLKREIRSQLPEALLQSQAGHRLVRLYNLAASQAVRSLFSQLRGAEGEAARWGYPSLVALFSCPDGAEQQAAFLQGVLTEVSVLRVHLARVAPLFVDFVKVGGAKCPGLKKMAFLFSKLDTTTQIENPTGLVICPLAPALCEKEQLRGALGVLTDASSPEEIRQLLAQHGPGSLRHSIQEVLRKGLVQ